MVYIPAVNRGVCARSLDQVEPMARTLIFEQLGVGADSFDVVLQVRR